MLIEHQLYAKHHARHFNSYCLCNLIISHGSSIVAGDTEINSLLQVSPHRMDKQFVPSAGLAGLGTTENKRKKQILLNLDENKPRLVKQYLNQA